MIKTDTFSSSYTTWKYYVVSQSMTNVGAGVDETRESEEGENYFYLNMINIKENSISIADTCQHTNSHSHASDDASTMFCVNKRQSRWPT